MENKDFSRWLIVSDIDGTLNNKLRRTPRVNTEAIDRFVHTLNGNFTLASARGVESLAPHYKNLPDVKTPAIVLNGAGIYDFGKGEMLWFNSVPESSTEIIKRAMDKFPFLEVGIFTDSDIYLVRPRFMAPFMMKLDSLSHKRAKSLNEVPGGRWGKVIFFCGPLLKGAVRDFVASLISDELSLIDTTSMSFDMVSSTTNKGNAVLALADILGVPTENTCAIGDYYNDLDMLKTVSHPACCKQAPEDIHKVCEYHACHCNKGAVADFLYYIENNY